MTRRLVAASILLVTLCGPALAPAPVVRGDAPLGNVSPQAANAAAVATGWLQVNSSGFATAGNSGIRGLAELNGQLYAATSNDFTGAQVWRSPDGYTWTAAMTNGLGGANNGIVDHLVAFGGDLYVGTENPAGGGEVWRSSNGMNWTQVVSNGFGNANQGEVIRLAVFGGKLYASTWSYDPEQGTEIWRSDTGDAGSWSRVVDNGFGDSYNASVPSFEVFGGLLYAATQNGIWVGQTSYTHGAEVWRSPNGTNWTRVGAGGFGDLNNSGISGLAAFGNYLYASTSVAQGGAEVWRCQTCSGSDWTRVVSNGFGNPQTHGMSALEVYAGRLYLVIGNSTTGMEVWRTANGTNWEQVGFGGFGDSRNRAPYWDSSVIVWDGRLFVGTWNIGTGGQIWMYLPNRVTLPVVLRGH
jgi:tripartite motif-containing protein 71